MVLGKDLVGVAAKVGGCRGGSQTCSGQWRAKMAFSAGARAWARMHVCPMSVIIRGKCYVRLRGRYKTKDWEWVVDGMAL
ncbi:unnamed protein product [Chondrus crispus]|uniref:Uncharacterized protein n=1 Tax=Chondrus crispus TaxID=2769 RepID=R7QRG7_CHOCR|nr:unnamed protein product [Chondrus crispus]CDF40076.1 unnamed protein product [Chondrus crispus]|eukprot:XP_005710370.1 unnamed protein product [Chondrus crispus]